MNQAIDENDPLAAVSKLQHELYLAHPRFMDREGVALISYVNDGICGGIEFLGINIWNSDRDPRPYDENFDDGTRRPSIYRWCLQEIDRISLEITRMLNSHRHMTVPPIQDQREPVETGEPGLSDRIRALDAFETASGRGTTPIKDSAKSPYTPNSIVIAVCYTDDVGQDGDWCEGPDGPQAIHRARTGLLACGFNAPEVEALLNKYGVIHLEPQELGAFDEDNWDRLHKHWIVALANGWTSYEADAIIIAEAARREQLAAVAVIAASNHEQPNV